MKPRKNAGRPWWERRGGRRFGIGILALSFLYLLVQMARHARTVTLPPVGLRSSLLLGAAILCVLVALVGLSALWLRLLVGLGARTPPGEVLAVALLSHPAKYLPGNVGHFVARAFLIGGRPEVGMTRAVASEALEVLILAADAAAIAAGTLLSSRGRLGLPAGVVPAGGWQVAAAVCAALLVLLAVLRRFAPRLARPLIGEEGVLPEMSWQELLYAMVLGLVFFVAHGVALGLLVMAESPASSPPCWWLPGIFATAWLPGYLTPGVPGGLGVREAILAALLAPFVGGGPALAASLLLRLVNVLGEGLAFALGILLRRWTNGRGVS